MASLGTAPRACGAGDALCGQGAACCVLPGCFGGLRTELLTDSFPCLQGKKSAVGCAGAWGSSPSASAAESPSLLCWDVSLGSWISCSSACPSHAAQRGSHGWAGAACWLLSPGAQQHRTRHFPLLLHKPSSSGVRQSRRFPCRGLFWLWAAGCQSPASFFCWCGSAAPERQGGGGGGGGKCTRAKISVKA